MFCWHYKHSFTTQLLGVHSVGCLLQEDVSVQGNDQQIQYLVQFGQQAPTQQVQVQGLTILFVI